MGISYRQVVNEEEAGNLPSIVDGNGHHLFRAEDVESWRIRNRRKDTKSLGHRHAQAMTMFDKGHHYVDVVRKLRVDVDEAKSLLRDWQKCQTVLTLTAPSLEKLKQLGCEDITSEKTLIAWLTKAVRPVRATVLLDIEEDA